MSRIRANQFVDKAGTGAPMFPQGLLANGTITGTATTAAQATALQTARTIGGVSFDGTANINLPGVNAAGNQNTTGTAAGLTGNPAIVVGNITAADGIFSGNVSIAKTLTYEDVKNIDSVGIVTAREGVFVPDNKKLQVGNVAGSADLDIYHNGSNTYIENGTGNLMITGNNTDKIHIRAHASKQEIVCFPSSKVELYHNDVKSFETAGGGAIVTGVCTATSYSGRHAEVPKNAKSGAYTLLKTDSGQCISTNSAVTVPNAVFASGDCITVFNDSSSAIALTQGSGLQLRKAGTTTTGSLSIKEFGLVTIWFNTGGTAIASGNLA